MIELELPFPPSLWRLYRGTGKGRHVSPEYRKWRQAANAQYIWQKSQLRKKSLKIEPIAGHFCLSVHLPEGMRRSNSDIDNRAKAILDWLQTMELIEDDKLCDSLSLSWVKMEGTNCKVKVSK